MASTAPKINPWENAQKQLDEAAKNLGCEESEGANGGSGQNESSIELVAGEG